MLTTFLTVWLLWGHGSPDEHRYIYFPLDGFTSYEECLKVKTEYWDTEKKAREVDQTRVPISYSCFPISFIPVEVK